jgi:hypothetical protein
MRRISWIDQGMRSDVLALRSTWFFWASACWPRHVDQHQVHGPAAKPVLSLRRRPARQRNFMTVEAAHPRPMHRNLTAVEADLALRRAPAVAHPASAAAVRRACELLPVLAQHLFDGSNSSRQTEALK